MRQLFILWVLMNLLFVACNKDNDDEMEREAFPEPLEQAINNLSSQDNLCDICTIEIIEFNGKKYYNLYCQIWSCMYCNVYDTAGNQVTFDENDWESFIETHKVIRIVPMCRK